MCRKMSKNIEISKKYDIIDKNKKGAIAREKIIFKLPKKIKRL